MVIIHHLSLHLQIEPPPRAVILVDQVVVLPDPPGPPFAGKEIPHLQPHHKEILVVPRALPTLPAVVAVLVVLENPQTAVLA